jgi:hypothetical protein
MIGVNKLELNIATMRAAVEEYLNKRALSTARVEVTAVWQPGGSDSAFTVLMKPKQETK